MMGHLLCICILLFTRVAFGISHAFPSLNALHPSTSSDTQVKAVHDLIYRQVHSRARDFSVTVDPNLGPKDRDTFKVITNHGHVSIVGSSGVAAAMGFYYYAKQYCGCHVSWAGKQFSLPHTLPTLDNPILVTTNDRFRYYQNVCTASYSFVWWQWERWEQELDWMAMQGINLALAFNGQEAIWHKVFLRLGFSEEELNTFYVGPPYMAWQRMGNLRSLGGGLSRSWHGQQVALQHKVLQRMQEFGMIPVLPAFAGHVPHAIKRLYPNVTVSSSTWGHLPDSYTDVYLLNVTDPLFQKIGTMMLKEYIAEYGTNHVYSADTFNEMVPPSGHPAYLAQAAQSVYSAMASVDPQAVWLMQAWLFRNPFWTTDRVKGLVTAVPQGHLLLLDLDAELRPMYQLFNSFYGQPFIWCMLHDFGGTVSLYGAIESINKGPSIARQFPNTTMVGIGLTPEGINQNNVVYEFMMENAWRPGPANLTHWFSSYSHQRYGQYTTAADTAWQLLKSSVYNSTDGSPTHGHGEVIIVKRPSLKRTPDVWYDPGLLFDAWNNMLAAASHLQNSSLFRYDLVDVTRQSLQVLGAWFYTEVIQAYHDNDLTALRGNSSQLLQLFSDLESLLASDSHFLLGRWLEAAKALATTSQERDMYENGARMQITIWGPSKKLTDYANKQWSGLIRDYYLPRWKLFISELEQSLIQGVPFNETSYDLEVSLKVEEPFVKERKVYPTYPTGDSVDIVRQLHNHYRALSQKHRTTIYHLMKRSKLRKSAGHHDGWSFS